MNFIYLSLQFDEVWKKKKKKLLQAVIQNPRLSPSCGAILWGSVILWLCDHHTCYHLLADKKQRALERYLGYLTTWLSSARLIPLTGTS